MGPVGRYSGCDPQETLAGLKSRNAAVSIVLSFRSEAQEAAAVVRLD